MAAMKAQRGSRSIFLPILNVGTRLVWVHDILKQIEMRKPSLMSVKYVALNETWRFIVPNVQKPTTTAVRANIRELPRRSYGATEKNNISSRKSGFKNWYFQNFNQMDEWYLNTTSKESVT
jgi:hypothetical protein